MLADVVVHFTAVSPQFAFINPPKYTLSSVVNSVWKITFKMLPGLQEFRDQKPEKDSVHAKLCTRKSCGATSITTVKHKVQPEKLCENCEKFNIMDNNNNCSLITFFFSV